MKTARISINDRLTQILIEGVLRSQAEINTFNYDDKLRELKDARTQRDMRSLAMYKCYLQYVQGAGR